ncbi:hypothetical protein JTE90_003172 [Oedothorax gibbosus]|uniref:Uncharacterized protein n=1 Tax=Oedothorax gibbosus TaxID=931172 RepID=A0AAV6UPH3_9ARAC|nr:hypothetical protein JTE90_003172 [Oedothorax gibbosus]
MTRVKETETRNTCCLKKIPRFTVSLSLRRGSPFDHGKAQTDAPATLFCGKGADPKPTWGGPRHRFTVSPVAEW